MEKRLESGLSDVDLNLIISSLKRNQQIEKVILFGSRAKGTFHNGSDVDIALLGNEIELNDILNLTSDIENLDLPYKFDLVIYNRIKEQGLIDHIDRVGKVIFQR
jgi:predicted nucleotidyltransferase